MYLVSDDLTKLSKLVTGKSAFYPEVVEALSKFTESVSQGELSPWWEKLQRLDRLTSRG